MKPLSEDLEYVVSIVFLGIAVGLITNDHPIAGGIVILSANIMLLHNLVRRAR